MDFLEGNFNIIPVLAPVDIASTITATPYVDLVNAQDCAFLVSFGVITTATPANNYDITLEAATAPTAAEAAIAYHYRVSAIVGGNTWGDTATATTAGIEVASTDDAKSYLIEAGPEWVNSQKADARYVRLRITDDDDMAAGLVSALAFIKPRYKQDTMVSATAAASA